MRILLATHLDHPRHPPVTALRHLVHELPDVSFDAFGLDSEDAFASVWNHANLTRVTPLRALRSRYDIIHVKTASRAALRLAAAHRAVPRRRARLVFTASIEPDPADGTFELMGRAVRMADYVTAISEATNRGLVTHFGRSAEALTPNGVDATFFTPSQQGLAGVGRRSTVGVVGFLSKRKRFDFVLALARVMPDVNFLIAGRAYTPAEQRAAEDAMRALSNVEYAGHVSKLELRDLLDRCRLLAFPSAREGSPSAVLEAQAMGVPVLAQPVSSLPEYVREGRNGWLREASIEAWRGIVRSVAQMPDAAYARIAAQTREETVQRHTWREAARRYRDAYDAAVAKREGPPRSPAHAG